MGAEYPPLPQKRELYCTIKIIVLRTDYQVNIITKNYSPASHTPQSAKIGGVACETKYTKIGK